MRFNYTGRKKIMRESVSVTLNEQSNGKVAPDININLAKYDLPSGAPVFLEFYSSGFLRRDQYGTCEDPVRRLPSQFSSTTQTSELKVRLKVLDPEPGSHKILALMKGARPEDESQSSAPARESLLALRAADLRGQVWRVVPSTGRDEHPELLIDRRLGDYQTLATTDWFQAMVMPAALEHILTDIIVIQEFSSSDEDSIWSGWLRFALYYSPVKEIPEINPEDDSTRQAAVQWIWDVVQNWAQTNDCSGRFDAFYRGMPNG